MNIKDRILRKSNLWHLGAIAVFLIVACVYFAPALKGYILKQPDIVNWIGMSREVKDFQDNSTEQVLWTNSMFSGMSSTQISMKYENTGLLRTLQTVLRFGLPRPIYYLFIYFLGFYVLALSLRIKPMIGIIGAIGFGLSSYFIIILEAGHNSKAAAIGFATFMIAGFIMSYRWKNWVLGVGLSSLFMALEVYVNHLQITYYMGFVLLLIGIAELIRYFKEKEILKFLKITGFLLIGYVLALMVNYGNVFGTAEYAKQTIRGGTELTINAQGVSTEGIKTSGLDREYITNWSYGIGETFSLVVPNFKGGETQAIGQNEENKEFLKEVNGQFKESVKQSNQYWGDQPFTSGPVYVGIIVMLLAFLGLIYVKSNYKWALLSVTLLAIALSWGKNYVSVLILIPILLYNFNMIISGKWQLIVSAVSTLLFFLIIGMGDPLTGYSLTDFFLDTLPGYNKFRAVTIILSVAELTIPFLGVLFLQRLVRERGEIKKDLTGFYIIGGVFLLFFLLLIGAPDLFNSFLSAQELASLDSVSGDSQMFMQYDAVYTALAETRQAIFHKDVVRSLFLFILAFGVMFAFLKTKLSSLILGVGLGVLIFIDLFGIAQRYVNTDKTGKSYAQWTEVYNYRYPYSAGDGEKQILAFEIASNPIIQVKIDSALQVLNKQFKEEGKLSAKEKQLRTDYLTYRILNRNSNFRVFEEGNAFNSSYTSYFNKSLGGYHGAKLSRYQDLIEFHLSKQNPAVMDMLNTKYYLRPGYDRQTRAINNSSLTRVNQGAMGNVWFSKSIKMVKNANEEILALESFNAIQLTDKGAGQVMVNGKPINGNTTVTGSESVSVLLPGMAAPMPIENIPYQAVNEQPLAMIVDSAGFNWVYDSAPDSLVNKVFSLAAGGRGGWDPKKETIMDERFQENVSASNYSGKGKIEMTAYHPDRMKYASSSSEKQLAVFSEIYYEGGWKAFVDGNEVPVLRANYALRAIEIPAGEHEIEFKFELLSYKRAGTMALIGSVLIILILILGIYIEIKRKDNDLEIDDVVDLIIKEENK